MLRYQVTRSSLISDRQVGEREKAGGVVSFQLPAPKTNDPHGRGVISPDPGLENATNYNRIRMVGAATRVEPYPRPSPRFVRRVCFTRLSSPSLSLSVFFPRTNYVSRVPVSQTPAGFLLGFNSVMVNGRYRLTKNRRVYLLELNRKGGNGFFS